MPLLDMPKPSNKVRAVVVLERSTVELIDRYAEYSEASADDVIEQALLYVFRKDSDFQEHVASTKDKAPKTSVVIAAKPGRKPSSSA